MKFNWKEKLFRTCDKTGKIKGIKLKNKWYYYLGLPFLGVLATLWILIRVIPKPSRLRYPCMKVAIPISSSFFVFLGGLITSILSFNKIKKILKSEKTSIALVATLVMISLVGIIISISGYSVLGYAKYATIQQTANQPIGEAQGIHPGRVVWVHNSDATNENCTMQHNGDGAANEDDDGWFLNKNNNQEVIDEMLDKAIMEISGKTDIAKAWEHIFRYHNSNRGKGDIGYQEGEKIFIKINVTSSWGYGFNWGNIKSDFTVAENDFYGISETSPHLILSLLRHLVNDFGIAQENIYIGDPMKHIYKHRFDLWNNEFPDVNYLDRSSSNNGREVVQVCDTAVIDYSDKGEVIAENTDTFYQIFEDCEYLLNVPTLKGHRRAGITMFAKNHFGSHTRDDASHLHPGLVNPDEVDYTGDERYGYGKYRVQVDLMGWDLIRKKALLYLMDALWSAGHEVTQPTKWKTAPFNNDWSSSIFVSQDQVAIESVGYDFLRHEYTVERHPNLTFVQMDGTDDYLEQAADSAYWPEDITYDPENDGTPIPSLGVHEHWNNPKDKEYSRNLGSGAGIELIKRDAANDTQDDTVIVQQVQEIPVIDGISDDLCWDNTEWQEIGQTWIPYGEFILSDDFTGRYKCVWNKDHNELYFLIETIDDTLVDGYEKGEGGYHNYDIVEVFIDEDNSGGPHIFDTDNSNAENAYSYHMNVNYPAVGDTVQKFLAMDIAGESWSNMYNPDYSNHFPEHVLRRYKNKVIREFSLKVYNDEIEPVELTKDKLIGLSIAYCDNDDINETPKERDGFYGSVEVTEERHNSHWESADDYGTVKLVDTTTVAIAGYRDNKLASEFRLAQNYPNPFNPTTMIEYNLPVESNVQIIVYDMTGRKVANLVDSKKSAGKHSTLWNAANLSSGVYFYKIMTENFTDVKKCILMK
mgnify:CR=1 FL=1